METLHGPRILVVDDDRKDMDQTLQAIRTHCSSYEARVADGAWEGLDYLFARGRFHERQRHPLPDVVLLAVGMQHIDGVEVLKRINEADYLRKIPVALLCDSEEERQRAMQEGVEACAVVVKPMTTDRLRGLLREASRTCRPDFGEGITAGWTTATLRAGRYELVCNLRNHSANRMLQARTVS